MASCGEVIARHSILGQGTCLPQPGTGPGSRELAGAEPAGSTKPKGSTEPAKAQSQQRGAREAERPAGSREPPGEAESPPGKQRAPRGSREPPGEAESPRASPEASHQARELRRAIRRFARGNETLRSAGRRCYPPRGPAGQGRSARGSGVCRIFAGRRLCGTQPGASRRQCFPVAFRRRCFPAPFGDRLRLAGETAPRSLRHGERRRDGG